jgi:hypothetical protein
LDRATQETVVIAPCPEALTVADQIAAALSDPKAVRTSGPHGGRAWPQSLAGGAVGIALLHIERAHASRGDWGTAHAWLSAASAGELTAGANAGLFVGVPAVAFVLHAAAGHSGGYRNALANLDKATVKITRARLAQAHARIDRGDRPELKEFDLIRGLTGLGIYHLRRHPDQLITREVLSYVVRLTAPLPRAGRLPPWWTDVSPNGGPTPGFPHGHGNLGLAHGIGAALALLSLAILEGINPAGGKEAVETICAWTDRWRGRQASATWWPGFITFGQHQEGRVDPAQRPRPSWCYGISGTARAQQLAGLALGDVARQREAENAMIETLRDPFQVERLPEIGLCHGMAGLLHAAQRMAADSRNPQLNAELAPLATHLAKAAATTPTTNPEFLDGATGAALALHTAGIGRLPASGWDSVLLLA